MRPEASKFEKIDTFMIPQKILTRMKKLLLLFILCSPIIGYGQTDVVKDFNGFFDYGESQIVQLAEAIPEDKYSWSPGEGVRSIGDVLGHIVQANYGITAGMGFALPEGVKMEDISKLKSKSELIAAVKASCAFVKEKTGSFTEANLSEKFKLPFGEFSKRAGVLLLLDHIAEHKGQLIAYARSNGIKPPWSE
jgi:uncharacterized damage-inducible protein DinB